MQLLFCKPILGMSTYFVSSVLDYSLINFGIFLRIYTYLHFSMVVLVIFLAVSLFQSKKAQTHYILLN